MTFLPSEPNWFLIVDETDDSVILERLPGRRSWRTKESGALKRPRRQMKQAPTLANLAEKVYLSRSEAAVYCGVSASTLDSHVRAGRLSRIKDGGVGKKGTKVMFRREVLDLFMRSRESKEWSATEEFLRKRRIGRD